jgi:hypothetical protein
VPRSSKEAPKIKFMKRLLLPSSLFIVALLLNIALAAWLSRRFDVNSAKCYRYKSTYGVALVDTLGTEILLFGDANAVHFFLFGNMSFQQSYVLKPVSQWPEKDILSEYFDGTSRNSIQIIKMSGWPVRCVWSKIEGSEHDAYVHPDKMVVTGGVRLLGPSSLKSLSVRPLWIGLIINSIMLYIILLVLVIPVRVAFRSFIIRTRRRYGLCVRCRYDIKNVVLDKCPECGFGLD